MVAWGNATASPPSQQRHVLADWAEVLCLTAVGGELSRADYESYFGRQRDEGTADEEISRLDREFGDEPITAATEAEYSDTISSRTNEVFEHLHSRADGYGSAYPFQLSEDGNVLRLRLTEPETAEGAAQRVYIFTLACANLRCIKKLSDRDDLAGLYEVLCVAVLQALMPATAEVHHFGKSKHNTGRYVGKAPDKIRKLAEDLCERCLFDEEDFDTRDTGDAGLDLVAWVPMGDLLSSTIIFFGQCACTLTWPSKRYSASAAAWSSTLTFSAPPTTVVFIPFDFRRIDRSWYFKRVVSDIVLVDRLRLMLSVSPLVDAEAESRVPLLTEILEIADSLMPVAHADTSQSA